MGRREWCRLQIVNRELRWGVKLGMWRRVCGRMWTRQSATGAFARSWFRRCVTLAVLEVDLDANANNLFPRLREECTLLPLKEPTRRPVVDGKGWRRGEQGHQFMARGWCGILPRTCVMVEREIEVWSDDEHEVLSQRTGIGNLPRSEDGESGRRGRDKSTGERGST